MTIITPVVMIQHMINHVFFLLDGRAALGRYDHMIERMLF